MSLDGRAHEDPLVWFRDSFARAERSESFEPSRAALATVDADGAPSVRFVLVKQVDDGGFAFFTNLTSAKARHLATQPRAALAFHWASIGEQVRVEGSVQPVTAAEADAYFASRPRGSQLSAWTSEQSTSIASRAELEAKYAEVEHRFASSSAVPRPPFWSGYRLVAVRIEFWRNRDDRLHDRWSFTRVAQGWRVERLQP
jgi:pyridoxamine 5'-phosphate oxidase